MDLQPSEMPVLYDTVTLHLFASQRRLDLLQDQYGHRPEPVWCAEVKSEVEKGRYHLQAKATSDRILGHPYFAGSGAPEPSDVEAVLRIVAALGDDATKNLGEAQSIVLAMERGGAFVTDDRNAYDFARRPARLGPERVTDACGILAAAVDGDSITDAERAAFHKGIPAHRSMRCRCMF